MSRMRTKPLALEAIVNGRLVTAESQQDCLYRYVIYPSNSRTGYIGTERTIKSPWEFYSGHGAFSAGKEAARILNVVPEPEKN